MRKAPPFDVEEFLKTMERERRETITARAEFGFFETWKRVADRKIDTLFSVIFIDGPTIPDDLREAVADHVYRFTWLDATDGMAEEERIAAWIENRDAINKYALELAERAVAERWKRMQAVSR